MKLFQINTVVNTRSTGKIAEDIGQLALSKGWESYIAYGRLNRPSESKLIRIGNDFDLIFHGIKTRMFDRHGFGSAHATKKLIKKIKEINPDVIHLHNIHGYYINVEILFEYLKESNIPVVWTFHDCWPFTGHCVHFTYAKCNKWQNQCFNCSEKRSYPSSLRDNSRENYSRKKTAFASLSTNKIALVPVSSWMEILLHKSFFGKYETQLIYNGIDLNKYYPSDNTEIVRSKYGLTNRFVLLAVASNWEARKGLQDCLKLAEKMKEDSIMIIVGLTEKQMKIMPDNVIGIRRTENTQELVDLYSCADLYINLTYEDNFPTTNLEAMACGTPVLTYRTGGSPEAIKESTGFVIEQGNIESIVNIIEKLKKEKTEIYSVACVEEVKAYYDKNKCYENYFELYDRLLKR